MSEDNNSGVSVCSFSETKHPGMTSVWSRAVTYAANACMHTQENYSDFARKDLVFFFTPLV